MEFNSSTLVRLGKQLSDSSSVLLAGNLENNDFSSDEDEEPINHFSDWESTSAGAGDDGFENIGMEDIFKCDSMFQNVTGVVGTIRKLVKLIVSGHINPSDILMQALSVSVQVKYCGKFSVRYTDSYGMFWAGVRNLQKSRSLIVFKEHFPIPTNLSRMKHKIIELCGLDPCTLGKSGLQSRSLCLWVEAKLKESSSKILGVSISIDGKRLDAEKDGYEDLAGINEGYSFTEEIKEQKVKLHEMEKLVRSVDTVINACFKFYDIMTEETAKLVTKLTSIKELLIRNLKQVEKNPGLSKYIYVLEQKKTEGVKLVTMIQEIQFDIITYVAKDRNCSDLVVSKLAESVDLGFQGNYHTFFNLVSDKYLQIITNLTVGIARRDICWGELIKAVSIPFSRINRGSELFATMFDMCLLHDSFLYKACGLSKQRPVAEMKGVYERARCKISCGQSTVEKIDVRVIASLCVFFAPITFGNNMVIREGGLFVLESIGCAPDFVVTSPDNDELIFCGKTFKVEVQTFRYTDEMLTASLASATIANASKGCLMVIYSEESMVVFKVSRNDELINSMITFAKSYINSAECLLKRSSEMIENISGIQSALATVASLTVTIGSYPLTSQVHESQRRMSTRPNLLMANPKPQTNVLLKDKEKLCSSFL